MLSTAKTMEVPDERQILPNPLATAAADYLSSAPPLSLSDNQTANRLGTFLTNWNFLTTDKWILQAVLAYKIPFLRLPRQWRARPTVVQEGQPTELMKGAIQSLISKGAISVVDPCPQTVHFNTLFSGESSRDRKVPPCDQPKGTKQISSKGGVPNGGAPHCSLSSTQGRLYDETRPQGCLLCSPDTSGVEEISSFPVQGNNLRVPLPPIRPLPGSPSLHKDPPSDCCQTAFRRDTNSHLLERSSPDPPSEGHIEQDFPLCAETFVQPGFHSETGEMFSGTNSSLSLSGCGTRHNLHVSCPARGTDQSDAGSMPGNARLSVNVTGQTVEPLRPHEPRRTDGTVGSTTILQSPATPAGSASPPVRMETKVSDIIVSTLPGGPEMVGVLSSADADYRCGAQPAMASRLGDAGAWRRQYNTSIVWNSKQPV